MNCMVRWARTAVILALVTEYSVADEVPLRDAPIARMGAPNATIGTPNAALGYLPADIELPTPWWREAIQVPLGIATKTASITADEAVIQSMAQSPDIQVFGIQPQIERTEITRQQAAFDWTNFLETTWNDRSDPIGSTLTTGSVDGRFQDRLLSGAGGTRKTTTGGTEFELAERTGWQKNNSTFLVPNPQTTSRLELTLTQPLLAGSGEAYNLRRVVEARLISEGSQAQSIARIQQYLLTVHERYWELYRARAIFLQRRRAAERAAQLAESLDRRAQLDASSRQIFRTRTAAAQQHAELIKAASNADMASVELRRLVGSIDFESELIPLQSPSIAKQPIDTSIAIQTALGKRAEIDAAVRDIRVAGVRLGASKNELMPRLDLIAGAYVAGLTPDRSFADAFGRQFSDGRPTYNMGLAWEQPAGSRAAKMVRYRRQLEMQEAMARYESAVQDVRRDVEIALHQIHLTYRSLIQRNHALMAAQDEAQFLLDRWNTAPGSDGPVILLLEDLISAQSRLADEENATVIAETEHAIAQVRYLKAIGTLIHTSPPLAATALPAASERAGSAGAIEPVETLPVPMPNMPEAMIESEINAPEQSMSLERSPLIEGGSQ